MHTETRDMISGVSTAVCGVTWRPSLVVCPNGATDQAITGQVTTSAMWWDAISIRDHSAATRWRSAQIGQEIPLYSAEGA